MHPGGSELFRIAQAFDVSVEYLMTGTEPDNTQTVREITEQIDSIKEKLDTIQ